MSSPHRDGVWAVIVAGGSGSRFGSLKPLAALAGRALLDWSCRAAATAAEGLVVVAPAGEADRFRAELPDLEDPDLEVTVVTGGPTRSASVRAGLTAVPARAEVIVVHDAARPLAGPALFAGVIAAVRGGADAALPVMEVTDTVKRVDPSGGVLETLERRGLVSVQTPQAFRASVLRRAHDSQAEATDDAALVEAIGGRVLGVPGEAANLKITRPIDLVVATALVGEAGAEWPAPVGSVGSPS